MLLNPAYLQQSGFWTGYVRFFGDVSNPYINLYTGSPMNTSFFAPRQPDDRSECKKTQGSVFCFIIYLLFPPLEEWKGALDLDAYFLALLVVIWLLIKIAKNFSQSREKLVLIETFWAEKWLIVSQQRALPTVDLEETQL